MYITGGQLNYSNSNYDEIIKNWNSVVSKKDSVLYFGIPFTDDEKKLKELVNELNGRICVIQDSSANNEVKKDILLRNGIMSVYRTPLFLTIDENSKLIFNYNPKDSEIGNNYYITFIDSDEVYNKDKHTLNLNYKNWGGQPVPLDNCVDILKRMIAFSEMEES